MVKKILLAVAGGVVALLVLTFALTLLLSYREFFGTAITWVLCICVGALAVFVIYLVVRYILDTLRKKDQDDEALSEHHIKEMLLSGEPRGKGAIRDGAVELGAVEASAAEAPSARPAFLFDMDAPAPEASGEVLRAAERTAELRKLEEEHRRKLAEAEVRARQAAQAEMAARERAVSETGRRHLAGTGELLRRTSEFAAQKPVPAPETPAPEAAAPAGEVKNVRRQAEAAAAALRRAAQMAARSQSFPAIRPDTLAGIGSNEKDGRPNLYDEARDGKVRYANEPVPFEASGEDSIWDRMQVRRSAAPILTQSEQRASRTGDTALEDITGDFEPVGYTEEIRLREERRAREAAYIPPVRTGSIKLEAVQEGVAQRGNPADTGGWTYSPARPPKAWTSRSIPGDMSAVQPDTPDARTEAAAERKAAATAERQAASASKTTAPPRPRTDTEKAKETAAKAGEKAAAARKAADNAGTGGTSSAARSVYRKTDAAAAPATAPGEEAAKRPRGRPPKPKTEEELNALKRPRGRPPKPRTEEELNAPKRPRGRPPKPKTEEELNAPKRPRGRPRKNPLPEEEQQSADS